MPNRNLLDTWDHRNPVSQRGQASYQGELIYCIDRWICSSGVTTADGFITIPARKVLYQKMGQSASQALAGHQSTFSALFSNGALRQGSNVLPIQQRLISAFTRMLRYSDHCRPDQPQHGAGRGTADRKDGGEGLIAAEGRISPGTICKTGTA